MLAPGLLEQHARDYPIERRLGRQRYQGFSSARVTLLAKARPANVKSKNSHEAKSKKIT
jgi:hypothetical protein